MANDKTSNDREPKCNFGVRELREAARPKTQPLALDDAGARSKSEKCGFDPYNTSGSFDRKKHWERVGRR